MLGLMEKSLNLKNIPSKYRICFNENCQLRNQCLHYHAYLLQPDGKVNGPAVYPSAWKSGQCQYFSEDKPVQKAWGFSHLYDNIPRYLQSEARRRVMRYFSSGKGPYYRYHHGEHTLSPRQQEDVMQILAQFGSTEGLTFDHYEMDYDFTC